MKTEICPGCGAGYVDASCAECGDEYCDECIREVRLAVSAGDRQRELKALCCQACAAMLTWR